MSICKTLFFNCSLVFCNFDKFLLNIENILKWRSYCFINIFFNVQTLFLSSNLFKHSLCFLVNGVHYLFGIFKTLARNIFFTFLYLYCSFLLIFILTYFTFRKFFIKNLKLTFPSFFGQFNFFLSHCFSGVNKFISSSKHFGKIRCALSHFIQCICKICAGPL